MSLVRVSELRPQEEEEKEVSAAAALMIPSGARWLPSHVQVTVVQARALRPKGGPDDVFVALQLGRQKHRTSVATQGGDGPRWGEECALELPPSSAPDELEAEALLLQLTVWQRALVGLDRFLGRAAVPLAALLEGGRSHPDKWYKLHSKPGKKEKERGEIQLSIQFTRHSLTASMFDLSVKDKPRSPFGRLKDKVKGRRKYDLESASAIVPSSSGGLDDSDLDLAGKKAKARGGGGGFFRSRLRKSSLTQSNTSLGSDSTVSSASSMVGIAGTAEAVMARSPSRHSSFSMERSVRDFWSSPKLTHKRALSDEVSQIKALPESKSIQSLKPQDEPVSRSSLCINGSHVYCEEPSPRPASLSAAAAPPLPPQSTPSKPGGSFGTGPGAPESELPPWSSGSLQKGPPKDPPRFIPSPPILAAQEEDKLSVKTIALNKHRGMVRMEEGLRVDSRPVQIATPMVFSSEVMRVRPREEEQRAKARVLHRGSSKDDSGRRLVGEGLGPAKDVVTAGGEERDQSGWRGLQDTKESLPKPSSQSEWLAAPEVAKNTCFSEDRGPASFVRVGKLQVESAVHRVSHCQAAAAVKPPSDWDDSFDAFATSRLRPEVWREAPRSPAAIVDGVAPAGVRDGAGPCENEGEPRDNASRKEGEEPSSASGGLLNSSPEEGLTGSLREQLERWSDNTALPWGAVFAPGACEEASRTGRSTGAEWSGESWHQIEQSASKGEMEAAVAWRGRGRVLSAGATGVLCDSKPALGQAVENAASRRASSEVVAPEEEEEENTPKASALEERALVLHGESPASEATAGSSSLADLHSWDLGRQEQPASLMAPDGGLQTTSEEVANEAPLKLGCSMEGGEGLAAREQEGKGECWAAELPPPKPPRRFTPLSLEEEANKVVWGTQVAGWQEGVIECEQQEDPAVQACQQGPPLGKVSTCPAPAVIIGAGGEGTCRVTEGLGLPAKAGNPPPANELTSQDVSSGDTVLVVSEGIGGTEQFATCPSQLSMGGLGQAGAQEEAGQLAGGEPDGPPWVSARSAEFPEQASVQAAQEFPRHQEAGARPFSTHPSPEAEASLSLLFRTALGEEHLQLPQDGPGWEQPEGPGPADSGLVSRLKQGNGLSLASSHVEPAGSSSSHVPPPAVPPHSQLPARTGASWTASKWDLSPSWSDDGTMDFKTAGFWQLAGGGQSSTCDTVLMPGNPFASWTGPPAKNNPFVEELPGALPAPASACPVSLAEGLGFRNVDTEADLQGLFPASHCEDQPAAPFLHGNQPLAASPPSLTAVLNPGGFGFPSPTVQLATNRGAVVSSPATVQPSLALPQLSGNGSAPSVLPAETQPAEEVLLQQTTSLHLVKPINTPVPETSREEEKQQQSSLTSGQNPILSSQQELKPSSPDSAAPVLQLAKTEPPKDPSVLDASAKYYHLTHEELIQLLLKQEVELSKKQDHVQELENYIDRLLVRIMEQSPTLLQIPLGGEPKVAK